MRLLTLRRTTTKTPSPATPREQEQSDAAFLSWLETTLIPDLFQSGQECLVEDFTRLIDIIKSEERWLEVADELGIK